MHTYYIIDINNIKSYLSNLDKNDKERTIGSLDYLIKNIDNNLFELLNDGKIMIEIDDEKKEVTLLGDDLPSQKWEVLFDKEVTSETIYNSIIRACEVIKKTKGGEKMITEIHPKQ